VGLVTLSGLIGIALGMVITPALELTMPISSIQLIYGAISLFSAVVFIILARDNPPTPPSAESTDDRALVLDGLKNALKNRMFWLLVFVQFLGMAIFNGLTTWIEPIFRNRQINSTQAGDLGALVLVGGVVGALVLPAFSDKLRKRKMFLFIGVASAIPFLLALTFFPTFSLLMVSAFMLGFFLVSASPIAMQFATEITFPTPEGTSNGLMQLFGQLSVVFVYVMEVMRTPDGSFTPSLILAAVLLVICVGTITFLKDPDFSAKPAEAAKPLPSERA
jgi:cyanate permease